HLENLLSKRNRQAVRHFAALPYTEVPEFVAKLREQQSVPARALEFAILTAARRNEAIEARWEELDLDAAVWWVPGERTKSGQPHRVPLSKPALDLLRRQHEVRNSEFAFSVRGGRSLGESTIRMFLRNAGFEGITTHGFRSSFRDWAAERTNFPPEVVEEALADTIASATERAHRRSDQFDRRQRRMDGGGRFCSGPAKSIAGEVVALGNR